MDAVVRAAVAAGLPQGSLRFLAALFAAPLVCAVQGVLPGTALRHVASAALGIAMCLFVYGVEGSARLAPPVVAAALIMALAPRRAGPITFVVAFAYLIYCHVASASGDAWKEGHIDYTGSLMVLVLKLISTAFDVGDGAKAKQALTPHQAASALPQRPSLLAFAGYVLYPGSLLAGPWLPFAEYAAFIQRSGVWAPSAPKRPSALLPAARRVALGVAYAALHARLAPAFPESAFLDGRWVASRSVPAKIAYMHAMGFAARCKYYFVWLLADAACCAGGLGWSGFQEADAAADAKRDDNKKRVARWERTCNVHPLGVELATSAAELPLSWNTATGAWLRHYCYERLLARPARLPPFAALLATQTMSGLWHGTHAGYVLFFVGSGLMLHAAKVIFRYQRAIPTAYARLRSLIALMHWGLTVFHLNYLAAAFISVTLPAGRAAFASVGYAGHASMAGICLLGAVLPPPKANKRAEAPSGAAARKRD